MNLTPNLIVWGAGIICWVIQIGLLLLIIHILGDGQ